jgi:hypothetical protein
MISPTWAQRKGPANVQAHPGDAQAPARGTMEVWGVDPLKMDQFKGKTAGNNHIVFPMKYGVFLWIYIYMFFFPQSEDMWRLQTLTSDGFPLFPSGEKGGMAWLRTTFLGNTLRVDDATVPWWENNKLGSSRRHFHHFWSQSYLYNI